MVLEGPFHVYWAAECSELPQRADGSNHNQEALQVL